MEGGRVYGTRGGRLGIGWSDLGWEGDGWAGIAKMWILDETFQDLEEGGRAVGLWDCGIVGQVQLAELLFPGIEY